MHSKVAETVPPDAGSLSESLRDFGYTLPQALADLIDNSLTAGATRVQVTLHAEGSDSAIAVLDNGRGMSEADLVEAMRLGTTGPLSPRSTGDLGRFGLGMKTASLSQGRSITVVTKLAVDRQVIVRRWDLDHISRAGWQLLSDMTDNARREASALENLHSGTAVIIEKLDRVSFATGTPQAAERNLTTVLAQIRDHLSMVFHHFIQEANTDIILGQTSVCAWDPFLADRATRLPAETLTFAGQQIEVTPFVLPHHSRLTDEEHARAAGPNGWNAHQGFYIYRSNRLVVPGTWLNLGMKKEEHYKLARIRVDLPNSVDHEWHLNVMKSHVSVPAALRPDFLRIAKDVRRQAAEVYRYRGEREVPQHTPPERYVWKRKQTVRGVRYLVDRTHPAIQALLNAGCRHEDLLEQSLKMIEQTMPISCILAEPPRSLEGMAVNPDPDTLQQLVEMLTFAEQFLIRNGLTPAAAREKVLQSEPFAKCRDRIIEFISGGNHVDTD